MRRRRPLPFSTRLHGSNDTLPRYDCPSPTRRRAEAIFEIGEEGAPAAAAARGSELAGKHEASRCCRGATAATGAAGAAAAGVGAAGVGVGEAGGGSGPGTVVRAMRESDERAVFVDTFDFELAIGNGEFHNGKERPAGSAENVVNNR